MLWSATAKRLLGKGFGEDLLAIVSLYLCVHEACLLVTGKRRIAPDQVALADCPIPLPDLHAMDRRLEALRNEVMHLADMTQKGRGFGTHHTHEPPYFVFESSVGDRGQLGHDSISRLEIEELLETLDPWIRRHWERIVHTDFSEDAATALREKIETTMLGLSRAEEGTENEPRT